MRSEKREAKSGEKSEKKREKKSEKRKSRSENREAKIEKRKKLPVLYLISTFFMKECGRGRDEEINIKRIKRNRAY